MYNEHPNIETPDRSLKIWRYMDLWKFLDIIDNRKLYMSRADTFEDKLEGRIPIKKVNKLEDGHPIKNLDGFSESSIKKSTYISCWCGEQEETYPMWKIYSDYRSAIAIKSTVGNLIDSISENARDQYVGKIKYVNPEETYIFKGNTYQLFFEKRDYFLFENEIRLLTSLPYENGRELLELPAGTKLEIEPETLIDEICLAPLADKNFKKLIELKLADIRLNKPVNFSDV